MNTSQIDERGGLRSASSLERLYHCAGAPLPKPDAIDTTKQDDVTTDGQMIHDALMTGDMTGLTAEQEAIARGLHEIEMRELEKWMWDLDPSAGPIEKRAKPEPKREQRLWVRRRDNLKCLASAKLDVYYVIGNDALVIDYKTGFLEATSADENIQLRVQALAVWHEHPHVQRIRVRIVQYRLGEMKSKAALYQLHDLKMAEQELMFRLYLAEQTNAPRVPGEWCRYCPAIDDCRENKVFAMLPSQVIGSSLDLTIEERVAKLAPQDKKFLWQNSRVIKAILEAVNDSLKSMPAEELKQLGLYVTPEQQIRGVSNIIDAYAILDKAGFLAGTDEEKARQFSTYCKMPLGAIEEALTEHFHSIDGGTKKAAKAKATELLRPIIITTPKAGFLKEL